MEKMYLTNKKLIVQSDKLINKTKQVTYNTIPVLVFIGMAYIAYHFN